MEYSSPCRSFPDCARMRSHSRIFSGSLVERLPVVDHNVLARQISLGHTRSLACEVGGGWRLPCKSTCEHLIVVWALAPTIGLKTDCYSRCKDSD